MNYIFDLDNTLLLSEEPKKKNQFECVDSMNISDVRKAQAKKRLHAILYEIGEISVFDTCRQVMQILFDFPDQKQIDDYTHFVLNQLKHKYIHNTPEAEGCRDLLAFLIAHNQPIGINTGNPVGIIKDFIKAKKWPFDERFVFGAGDVETENPYCLKTKANNIHRFVNAIIESQKNTQSFDQELSQTIMIGDSMMDYNAAMTAKCRFIGINHFNTPDILPKTNAPIFHSFKELKDHIATSLL